MVTAGNHGGNGLLDGGHDVFGAQPDLGIRAVEHHDPPFPRVPQQIKGVHGEPEVLDRGDIQGGQ